MTVIDWLPADPHWFTVAGLMLDFAGAALIAWGVFAPRSRIRDDLIKETTTIFFEGHTKESAEKSPLYFDRLRLSKTAFRGAVLIAIGLLLQIIGAWPR